MLIAISGLIIGCKDAQDKVILKPENVSKGRRLFAAVGCANCHSMTGEKLYGPPLNNIIDSTIKVFRNDTEMALIVDRVYIRKSITEPDFEKPLDFRNSMMPKPDLTAEEIDCLVDFIIASNSNRKP